MSHLLLYIYFWLLPVGLVADLPRPDALLNSLQAGRAVRFTFYSWDPAKWGKRILLRVNAAGALSGCFFAVGVDSG